jgi:hypothetical protein
MSRGGRIKNVLKFLFVAGCVLMAINAVGLFVPLRNSEIYTDPLTAFPNDITLTYEEFRQQVQREPGESGRDYVYRLTSVVNRGMAHYWHNEGLDKYRIHVPVWENYILYLGGLIQPQHLVKYHFQSIEKTMERGVGWCSQEAMLITRLFLREGFNAQTVFKPDHVVARVQLDDGSWLISDPDYGVVLPFDISDIEANPGIVKPYYKSIPRNDWAARGQNYEPVEEVMATIYSDPGTWYLTRDGDLASLARSEDTVYALKWMIPAGLLAPYMLLWLDALRKKVSLPGTRGLKTTTTPAS